MKVRKTQIDKDLLCHGSLEFLSARISLFFEKNFPGSPIWIADDSSSWKQVDPEGTTNIILYGNYLRDFIESETWPGKNYKIWVLSQKVKDCLTKLIKIPESSVSVIPRKYLVDSNQNSQLSDQYVYGGRISRQKNILDLLLTHAFLQNIKSTEISLNLFGDFDDSYHEDHGRFNFKHPFKEVITKCLDSIHWKNKPLIQSGLNSMEWIKKIPSNSCFISMSKFHMEDFGVSIAQMQELGIHSLLTSWGGYTDIENSSATFISDQFVQGHSASLGLRAAHAKKLAHIINEKEFKKIDHSQVQLIQPEIVTATDLNALRASLLSTLGSEIVNIPRDKVSLFADSTQGQQFYKKCREIFSSDSINKDTVIIISHQLGNESLEENQAIYSKSRKLLENENNIRFLSMDSISAISKESTAELLKAKDILCTKSTIDQSNSLKMHLENLGVEYNILTEEEDLPLGIGSLSSYV